MVGGGGGVRMGGGGGWFESGKGNLHSPLMAFFKHTCYRHIHQILTFHTSGDIWPVAFY